MTVIIIIIIIDSSSNGNNNINDMLTNSLKLERFKRENCVFKHENIIYALSIVKNFYQLLNVYHDFVFGLNTFALQA